MVYDSLEYAAQVQKAEASHKKARKEKDPKEKKPNYAEFLSGFYREDRLRALDDPAFRQKLLEEYGID